MMRTLIMSLAVTAMLTELAMAENYTVGGSNGGWDTSTNLKTWASSQSFSVGDNLIFQYSLNHDVVEVPKSDYDSCQASNPVQSYSSSPTIIPLASPGKRYFICGTTGHCSQGMKVEIDTLATTASPPAAASPPSPLPASPVSSPASPPSPLPASPVSSPPPETATPPLPLSPESVPTESPSPTNSPTSSSTPDIPTTESRTNSLSPTGSSPLSAHCSNFEARLAMGFSSVMMMIVLGL